MQKLRVGVVGCGEIAQIMHLPFLHELPHFAIGAICDISPQILDAVGDQYGVANRHTDYRDLVARDDLDAVAVLTMDHVDVVLAAAQAGKHLFIEKPLCFDPVDADAMLDAARQNRVQLMVGYMKRYDPGYEYAAAYMKQMEDVRLIRVQDLTGVFNAHAQLYTLVKGDDIPPAALNEQRERIQASMMTALGPERERHRELYRMLLMLCSHDLAILRGAFGAPDAVLYSDAPSAFAITSLLAYGDGRRCIFEAGTWPRYAWFQEQLIAYGREEIVTVSFPNPYVKYAPTRVTIEGRENCSPVRKETAVSHQEAFRLEWLHFYDCITQGIEPRTTGIEAKADVELALEMIRAIP